MKTLAEIVVGAIVVALWAAVAVVTSQSQAETAPPEPALHVALAAGAAPARAGLPAQAPSP